MPVPAGDSISVTLSPAASRGSATLVHLTPDHAIAYRSLQVWLEAGGAWYWRSTETAIPEGDERELRALPYSTWQEVTGVRVRTLAVRTLDGSAATPDEVRDWQCEPQAADQHALDARYACALQASAELTSAEDVPLWVYLVSGRNQRIEAHARSRHRLATLKVFVLYRRAGDYTTATGLMRSEFCGSGPYSAAGVTERMACGGYDGWNGISSRPILADVLYVTAYEDTAKYLRCVRHSASTEERSVWVCAGW